jgi:hypothetical protein
MNRVQANIAEVKLDVMIGSPTNSQFLSHLGSSALHKDLWNKCGCLKLSLSAGNFN